MESNVRFLAWLILIAVTLGVGIIGFLVRLCSWPTAGGERDHSLLPGGAPVECAQEKRARSSLRVYAELAVLGLGSCAMAALLILILSSPSSG